MSMAWSMTEYYGIDCSHGMVREKEGEALCKGVGGPYRCSKSGFSNTKYDE